MSKPGRQRRTRGERIEAKLARQVMVVETRAERQRQFDELFADMLDTPDETLTEIAALADEKQ